MQYICKSPQKAHKPKAYKRAASLPNTLEIYDSDSEYFKNIRVQEIIYRIEVIMNRKIQSFVNFVYKGTIMVKGKILVIDDEDQLSKALSRIIGYEVKNHKLLFLTFY